MSDKMALDSISGGLMTAESLQSLRSQILALSEAERAELAHDLLQSLDAPRDNGTEEDWDREITSRIAEIDAGQAELVDRAEFRKRIGAQLERG
jgi:putative addiction module component (TIGR02574 family)